MTTFVMSIAGISLLVAAVSIFNVMLMSVTERIHEIGILRSIGTQKDEILRMFVYEAAILGFVGAAIGAGKRAVLAEFRSRPVAAPVEAATATAILYLVTGQAGMENCAVVTAELARRSPLDERTVVGSGSLPTSILPRRRTVDPIVVTGSGDAA